MDRAPDGAFNARTDGDLEDAEELFQGIQEFMFLGGSNTNVPSRSARSSPPFGPFGAPGSPTDYPHTLERP